MNRIKKLRDEKHWSQVRLSTELGVSQEAISGYENGKNYPSAENLLKMRTIFNASIDYILGVSNVRAQIYQGDLTVEEIEIISRHRKLTKEQAAKVSGFIQGIINLQENK